MSIKNTKMQKRKRQRRPKTKPLYKGQTMASRFEVRFAKECQHRGIKWAYEPAEFPWTPRPRKYHPDFSITRKNGSVFYLELKGYLRMDDKTKMRAIKEQYPDLDIRFIFADASKPVAGARVRKDGTKQTHKEWAEKHGYEWAEGFIPKEWLKPQS